MTATDLLQPPGLQPLVASVDLQDWAVHLTHASCHEYILWHGAG